MYLVMCKNTKENFLWKAHKINVKRHIMTSCTWNFMNFTCVFTILVKFDIHFLSQEFSLVLSQVPNYSSSPWKMQYSLNNSGTRFVKITQFPGRFGLNVISKFLVNFCICIVVVNFLFQSWAQVELTDALFLNFFNPLKMQLFILYFGFVYLQMKSSLYWLLSISQKNWAGRGIF